ncbi:MAG: 50S ribosomal protein L15 [Treponema sp.]|nr:50S ribosomal protein L15 [Treponema sp.]
MAELLLHAPKGANKKPKRVGRGSSSGLGTTAGRGNKGQQSRSGKKQPYVGFEGGQMPLYRRIARRGFSNYPFRKEYVIFNLSELETRFADGDTIDRASLLEKGLIRRSDKYVKVLGDGELTKKFSVDVDKVSASAKEKIEKAGGSVKVSAEPEAKAN